MPITQVEPISQGSYTQWVLGAGANKPDACTLPDDDIASYIKTDTAGDDETYNMTNIGASSIASVVGRLRVSDSAGAWTFKHKIHDGVNTLAGVNKNSGGWATHTHTWPTAADGGGWTPAKFAVTQAGLRGTVDPGGWLYCSTVYMDVTYVPVAGGFSFLLAQWLPPLFAIASHGLSKFDIGTVLSSLRTRPSSDEEFARIIEAFQRRPAYGFSW